MRKNLVVALFYRNGMKEILNIQKEISDEYTREYTNISADQITIVRRVDQTSLKENDTEGKLYHFVYWKNSPKGYKCFREVKELIKQEHIPDGAA